MKSKTSFINRTILEKNIKLYWPIWVLYTVILLVQGPVSMWSRYRTVQYYYGAKWKKLELDNMSPVISMRLTIILIFIMAIVTGMALFSYMYNSRACNMIHAMPVTRKQLFNTNVVTGLLFMCVPQIIKYAVSLLVCISYGTTQVSYLGVWLLASLGISFFVYSLVCLAAMLTGQLIAVPVMYGVINAIYGAIVVVIAKVASYVSYGLVFSKIVQKANLTWLAPFVQMLNRVGFDPTMKENVNFNYCAQYRFRGTGTILFYVCAAFVIYALAYELYKHRNLENVGNLIAVPFLKPVFKWSVGCLAGLEFSILLADLLSGMRVHVNLTAILLIAVALGMIAFMLLDMLIKKNFRVISKKFLKELIPYGVFVVAAFGAISVYGRIEEQKIPKTADVEYAYINMDYQLKMTNKDIQKVIDTQKTIMDQKDYYFKHRNEEETSYVMIEYVLKDGSKVYRNYEVPDSVNIQKKCKALADEEKKPENIMKLIMECSDADRAVFTGGSAAQYDENYNTLYDKDFDGRVAKSLYKAIRKDAEEGNIQEYVVPTLYDKTGMDGYLFNLNLTFTLPAGEETSTMSYEESSTIVGRMLNDVGIRVDDVTYETNYSDGISTYSVNVEFGPKCENIINALEKNKLIDSKDSLLTYEQLSD
ncbi:hypothetical protein [Agathobacter sp.]